MEINLTNEQKQRLAKSQGILGQERALSFLLDELHWAAIDCFQMYRKGPSCDSGTKARVVERLADLRVKVEMLQMSDWVASEPLNAAVEASIADIEVAAAERLKRNARRS